MKKLSLSKNLSVALSAVPNFDNITRCIRINGVWRVWYRSE